MERLNISDHISRQFNEELENVRGQVLKMGGLVEEQMALAVQALVNGDAELAERVILNDYRINALDVAIDEECTRIVARRQPAATDLRLVMAVIKTITDLERIGDEAKRVARMVVEHLSGSVNDEVRQEMEHMGVLVREMLRGVLDAFARTDVDTAMAVVRADRKVDAKYGAITRQLMTYMAEDPRSIPMTLNILWAARAMERIGDRCQNIAEYIFYLVHGRDIRHTSIEDAELEHAREQARERESGQESE
ncbi:phosphate signaling complex protein PhoU [Elongatibacter sediminis]|uniref:Phosphate-specific transport system accessory protein PhoU n=1 Tax=Elongatibacter sediminis TaxID=3119006 RepID=A0AAW9RLI3_9GAMM